jgi:hypothetical protein
MPVTSTSFEKQEAPCGRIVEVSRREDCDGDCMLTRDLQYACGCRNLSHEYHDGAVSRKIVRHDHVILVDEFISAA